ncbi:ankyrin repeat domain containing protein [Perkinsus marinus ATCC 50983]|uniref:Ankyrin repeat domain containing protein n=1 Tax=Perkinsus marinus (strain ATCC 50983 / TXsc) TaxID=423536 RepID=C5L4L5_PERM5|nr:ankyrin repeat domain containing protein [Perkinsus marinus ATCC 50983]EER08346.1 ankyrin repeat domain containing protein [Perkinsus marinus ATCC 50983]|eukprot:XP_002776530.1 ankyrin repeat domain containing protein [Perkinsus marinus ATCC 50983]
MTTERHSVKFHSTWANEPPTEAEKAKVKSERALMRAVLAGNKVAVEAAIEELPRNGGDINAEGSGDFTPLMTACLAGNPKVVTFFLSKGANINASSRKGKMPLAIAEEAGHQAVVEALQSAL